MRGALFIIFILTVTKVVKCLAEDDPCLTARDTLGDMKRRFSNYKLDVKDNEYPISDKDIIPLDGKWFKIVKQEMPTITHGLYSCGTHNPIYLKGKLPTKQDGEVNRVACLYAPGNDCQEKFNIKIKLCDGFTAYFLPSVRDCDVAYCFGDGTFDTPPTYRPDDVIVVPGDGKDESREAGLRFGCKFSTSDDISLYYQVYWYKNDDLVWISSVEKEDIYKKTQLNITDAEIVFKIQCAVRAKNIPDGVPGPRSSSAPFFARKQQETGDSHVNQRNKTYACSIVNDPLMTNVEGEQFELRDIGSFIMYDNGNGHDQTVQVQIKIKSCNPNHCRRSYCTCGFAVRAGKNVFVTNYCSKNTQNLEFSRCEDGLLNVTKHVGNERRYNIILPTGTEVEVNVDTYALKHNVNSVFNVQVYPSVGDFKKTQGLCGNFSGIPSDDFKHSNGTLSTYASEAFIKSWSPEAASVPDLFHIDENDVFGPAKKREEDIMSCKPNKVVKYYLSADGTKMYTEHDAQERRNHMYRRMLQDEHNGTP